MRILRSDEFDRRLKGLVDVRAQARILVAVQRIKDGNFGDCRSVGGGVLESRIHCGPGYRVYYARSGHQLVLLLLCGDKSTQARDIVLAKQMIKSR
jgi:putative addiction module killer protein